MVPVRECRHAVGGKARWQEDASAPGDPRFVGSRIHGKDFDALAATVIDDMKSGQRPAQVANAQTLRAEGG
jgi:hypothetical protein